MHTAFSAPSSPPAAHLTVGSVPMTERFLKLPEVLHLCGLSRSTLYELIARNAFPAQLSLGGKSVAWLQSEITAWMAERIAERNQGSNA